MPDLVPGEDDNDDNQNDDNDEHANQSSISLVITVSKGNRPVLEFSVTAYLDESHIDSLAVKNPEDSEDQIAYEGPHFHDLDENLQKAFHKYLEVVEQEVSSGENYNNGVSVKNPNCPSLFPMLLMEQDLFWEDDELVSLFSKEEQQQTHFVKKNKNKK
ncbi:hypothetical protein D8674_010757 [Pyrus ussuriensis x Pyrus communis]|uniref:Uncharacterized protein n=2 Tax=Pyrus TaxID=3766 RepID=A0A5N5FBL7_9ROSA|nr:hypothetical protein D8674_010757 [Pyrus ussuriensis x Pyrus communis]